MTVAILGSNGRLGRALIREFSRWPGLYVKALFRCDVDVSLESPIDERLGGMDFDVFVNATGFANVDECETREAEACRINGEAVGIMAAVCRKKGARFIHFSSDYVFDGCNSDSYTEGDAAKPLSAYGRSKLLGEQLALSSNSEALVIRTSWLFGSDKPSFPEWVLRQAAARSPLRVVSDRFGSPTYACDLAQWVALLIDRHRKLSGILHLSNSGTCSWHEYAEFIVKHAGLCALAEPIRSDEVPRLIALRPERSSLSCKRFTALTGIVPRPWQDAVGAHLHDAAEA